MWLENEKKITNKTKLKYPRNYIVYHLYISKYINFLYALFVSYFRDKIKILSAKVLNENRFVFSYQLLGEIC